ncbi:hypothetical protein AOZ07_02975 [Glutamicibacter halophytocola]|nr:hypothetical protein AOZ07_02975 [Glutamicibacter halophytocola]
MIRLYRAACEYLEAMTEAIRSEEPAPEGATSQVEHANQYEPNEGHRHYREPEWEDRQRIGFRSTK